MSSLKIKTETAFGLKIESETNIFSTFFGHGHPESSTFSWVASMLFKKYHDEGMFGGLQAFKFDFVCGNQTNVMTTSRHPNHEKQLIQ